MPKILVACPIAERAWAVPYWYAGIEAQQMDLDVMCLLTPSQDDTEKLLKERDVTVHYDEEPPRKLNEINQHHWGMQKTYGYMARLRNRLLDFAEDYDYFLSLDSDIVLPPRALQKMLAVIQAHPGVVSPAVNMAVGQTAWNTMSWVNVDRPSLAHRPVKQPPDGRADVVMAAMLLDAGAVERCRWVEHPQGEDVGFSLDCEAVHVRRYWLSDIRCEHMMRPR